MRAFLFAILIASLHLASLLYYLILFLSFSADVASPLGAFVDVLSTAVTKGFNGAEMSAEKRNNTK